MSRSALTVRTTAGIAAILVATVGITACSSSAKKPAASTTTPAPTTSAAAPTSSAPPATSSSAAPTVTASGSPADAATVAAVTKAFTDFFSGTTKTLAQTEALVQNGTELSASLAAQSKNPTAKTLSATVTSVALMNANVANVIFTLNSNGSPLLANNPGLAVKQNGVWKIAAQTYCGLVAAEGQAPAQCHDPKVTNLPS